MKTWQPIRFFRSDTETARSRNRLPHWEQEGACYFLTFRLADSLPAPLLRRWRDERVRWLTFHPQPWDEKTELEYHHRFSTKIDEWLDAGHGACRLATTATRDVVATSFHHFDGDRYLLHGFVIMPNHVHLLLSLAPDRTLESLIISWKTYTARQANLLEGRTGPFWQRDYFDRLIRHQKHFRNVVRYLRRNARSDARSHHYEAGWIKEGLLPGAPS